MKQIWHPWTEWECCKAGMFDGEITMTPDEALQAYADFLGDIPRFQAAMGRVVKEWPKSCEHFLTNQSVNRIAWLGQSAMCMATGVPCKFRAGYNLLTNEQREAANDAARQVLKEWTRNHAATHRTLCQNVEDPWLFARHP